VSRRDVWLFATLGWDPTWQRRVPRRIKIAWTVALMVIGMSLGLITVIGGRYAPRPAFLLLLALMVVGLSALSVIQYFIRREVMNRLDVEQDHRAARQIQARLLPSVLPKPTGTELAGHYEPFSLVGGDYYEARLLDDGRLLIVIADVSGKGAAAALLTANLQALLQFAHLRQDSPDVVVSRMNEHLCRYTEYSRFVTMVLAVYDCAGRSLTYVNAGHNPPIGVMDGGLAISLDPTGPALGMFETARWESRQVVVPPGAKFLFYTDGLSERTNRHDEQYGFDRIQRLLQTQSGRPAADIVGSVVSDVERFAAGHPADDDTALLVLRSC
jgi:sigma-B regulation protein RsbU (phosphoserine phosphatase)